jgi:CheY-like chemotaxis protein
VAVAAPILVAVPDLLLQSRIAEAARRVGARCAFAGTPDEVLAEARREGPALIILDLDSPRLQATRALALLREAGLDVPTLGCYGHVRPEVAAAAQRAGLREAMTRGQLVQRLDEVVARYAGP